jgi:hypothetical protein
MYWLITHRKRTESKNFLYEIYTPDSQKKDYEGEIQIQIHEIDYIKEKLCKGTNKDHHTKTQSAKIADYCSTCYNLNGLPSFIVENT